MSGRQTEFEFSGAPVPGDGHSYPTLLSRMGSCPPAFNLSPEPSAEISLIRLLGYPRCCFVRCCGNDSLQLPTPPPGSTGAPRMAAQNACVMDRLDGLQAPAWKWSMTAFPIVVGFGLFPPRAQVSWGCEVRKSETSET